MREILFRGKRIDSGEWAEGSLSTEYYQNHGIILICPSEDEAYKVDPTTVGQSTGLTANGKKIFEGDFVKVTGLCPDRDGEKRIWRRFRVGEVFYYHGAFYFDKWLLCKTSEKCIEIIGNIHDKPELLEDKP